ncbi:MAG: antitoxin family protein [Planctomycetia bacterium]|nr:antitoxin family protein [Planctomycetia bacterium]
MELVRAVYENGVFRPIAPPDLPEHCEVEFVPQVVGAQGEVPSLMDVYETLSARFDSGEHDVAERHNEHQIL